MYNMLSSAGPAVRRGLPEGCARVGSGFMEAEMGATDMVIDGKPSFSKCEIQGPGHSVRMFSILQP